MRRPPPEPLRPGVVHVWTLDLASAGAAPLSVLAPEEVERAARFRFGPDRARFVRARVTLRVLLGWYLDEAPQDLQITYGPHGKPYAPGHRIEFSVSHAADRAAYAFATDRRVGVDIEKVESRLAPSDLTAQIVSPRDYVAARATGHATAQGALTAAELVALWSKKEAAAKAVGVGVSVGPHNITVSGARGGLHRARVVTGDHGATVVSVRAFEIATGFAGAVAADECDWTLRVDELPASVFGVADRDGHL